MAKLIIIAGPQSSGKTTVFQFLQKKFPSFRFVPETNMYSVADKNHRGAAYVKKDLEIKIVEKDLEKIEKISRSVRTVVMETGIFHLMYLEAIADKETAELYYLKYRKAHGKLQPVILFIDTKPAVSWKRRKPIYEKRIKCLKEPKEKKQVMQKYSSTIERFYPLWHKWYKKFPFEKYMIRNSYKTEEAFLKETMALFRKYIIAKT